MQTEQILGPRLTKVFEPFVNVQEKVIQSFRTFIRGRSMICVCRSEISLECPYFLVKVDEIFMLLEKIVPMQLIKTASQDMVRVVGVNGDDTMHLIEQIAVFCIQRYRHLEE